ncbi:MAG: hypothetical protein F4Z95_02430 [Gammaproteobacteria bacterium]|nr:hypothetical protein [Gammaproteobacteria bacterium]
MAAFDPNPCRAETPGFEALGGWLKNDGREIGDSRVWLRDSGELDVPLEDSHAARVNATFNACGVREIARYVEGASIQSLQSMMDEANLSHGLLISSSFYRSPEFGTDPLEWFRFLDNDGDASDTDVMLITGLGNGAGRPTAHVVDYSEDPDVANTEYFDSLAEALKPENLDSVLWILVGGHAENDDGEFRLASASSICGTADPLCLFAPFTYEYTGDDGSTSILTGTSFSTPQVSAALDTVWAVWPDMDILDLRNLAFDCAENMPAREGDTSTERTFSYSNGREFTSTTNSTWGHGILSLTCLFTPNGGLQNPVTGDAISGGIFGPLAGPVTGASITGVDYTGRDFGYGFARPVARENFALASLAFGGRSTLRPVQASTRHHGVGYAQGAYGGRLWQSGALSVDLTAAGASGGFGGGAIGAAVGWQSGGWMIRGGIATQPEAVGSLTGSRAFRAPSTVSAAVTAAYAKALPHGFSMHVQADHWRTVATHGRSLWESADLAESRVGASVVKRAGPHEFSIQAVWQSGLSGSLGVDGRVWPVAGVRERGVWLTWRGIGIR